MKEKYGLPVLCMLVFAMTRWPGLMPANFSAVYGLVFCAGVFIPGSMGWLLPMGIMLITDLVLNWHYGVELVNSYMLANYVAYAGIFALCKLFSRKSPWYLLVCGGMLGALVFYVITNTIAWLQNPEYVKTLAGWIQALTLGTSGFPPTIEFFRNSLLSGGLFTGLFAGACKLAERAEPEEETEPAEEAEPEGAEAEPGESKA